MGTIETKCVFYGNDWAPPHREDLVVTGIRKGNEISLLIRILHQRATSMPTISERCGGALGIQIFGTITRFRNLFEQLLIFSTKEHYTLIIDEFQELANVNPSIFSEIQNL